MLGAVRRLVDRDQWRDWLSDRLVRWVIASGVVIIVALLAQIYLSLLALMVLLDLHPPARIVNLFRLLAGGLVGLQFGISPIGSPLSEPALTLGFLLSAVSLYSAAGFFAMRSRADWQRIAIRIAGSWIVAIAVIYIAYLIKRIW